jgi:lysozyme
LDNKQLVARGLVTVAVAVGGFEGLRTVAYLDPVGIPTVCFGETEGVRLGQKFTRTECEQKLAARIIEFDNVVHKCIGYTPAPGPRAAMVSLAYNIGPTAFCTSTLARHARNGDLLQACNEFPRWIYAKGVILPGLVKRRAEEQQLCMSAIA